MSLQRQCPLWVHVFQRLNYCMFPKSHLACTVLYVTEGRLPRTGHCDQPLNVAVVVAVAVGKEDEGDVLQRSPERALATEGSERHAPGERCPAFAREHRIGRGGNDTEQALSKALLGRDGGAGTEPLANPCWGLHSGHRRRRIAEPRGLGLRITASRAHALVALLSGSTPCLAFCTLCCL